MTIRVLLFASYAEATGANELSLEVPERAHVQEVIDHVKALCAPGRVPPSPLVAVNATYASAQHELVAGDEVAIIPPVAGG
jgi:molybdopterin converting factor subunit 1